MWGMRMVIQANHDKDYKENHSQQNSGYPKSCVTGALPVRAADTSTLSDKRCLAVPYDFYMEYDIKEFIKRLKIYLKDFGVVYSVPFNVRNDMLKEIDKLAGDKLT